MPVIFPQTLSIFSCLTLFPNGIWYDFFCCYFLISICYLINYYHLARASANMMLPSSTFYLSLGLSSIDSFYFTTKVAVLFKLIINNQLIFDNKVILYYSLPTYIFCFHLFRHISSPFENWEQFHSVWFFPFI